MTPEEYFDYIWRELQPGPGWEGRLKELVADTIREVIMLEQERCIRIVENETGWTPAYYDDPQRPTQVSHVDLGTTLERIAAAIRAAGEGE